MMLLKHNSYDTKEYYNMNNYYLFSCMIIHAYNTTTFCTVNLWKVAQIDFGVFMFNRPYLWFGNCKIYQINVIWKLNMLTWYKHGPDFTCCNFLGHTVYTNIIFPFFSLTGRVYLASTLTHAFLSSTRILFLRLILRHMWHDQGKWVTCRKFQFQFSYTNFIKPWSASF